MIKPAGHRVVVKQDKLEEVDPKYAKAKSFGLVLAEHQDIKREQNGVDTGVVLSIGETAWKDFDTDPWCKVGDRIAFAKHAGKYLKDGEDEVLIINDEDVVAVLGD